MAETERREYEVLFAREPASIEDLLPLLEAYVATGATDWTAERLAETAMKRAPDRTFSIRVVVEKGQAEPLGFVAAQLQPGYSEPEVFVLAAYTSPGSGLGASQALWRSVRAWGKALGVRRYVARTMRASEEGLVEPHAWARFGFKFDSALMVAEEPLELADRGEQGDGQG